MKKYSSIAELIKDYRAFKNLSQLDLSVLLNVDTRTINRWENGVTVLNPMMKNKIVNTLYIPHQVIQNLNSPVPIPVFYDMKYRAYSIDGLDKYVPAASWFKHNFGTEDNRVEFINPKNGVELFNAIQSFRVSPKKISQGLLEYSVNLFPELNVQVRDYLGYYSGHLIIFNLKPEVFEQIKSRELNEEDITEKHFSKILEKEQGVLYLYLGNGDSLSDIYCLMNYLFSFIKKNHLMGYRFATIESRASNIKIFKELGIEERWVSNKNPKGSLTLLEGTFDNFLFSNKP